MKLGEIHVFCGTFRPSSSSSLFLEPEEALFILPILLQPLTSKSSKLGTCSLKLYPPHESPDPFGRVERSMVGGNPAITYYYCKSKASIVAVTGSLSVSWFYEYCGSTIAVVSIMSSHKTKIKLFLLYEILSSEVGIVMPVALCSRYTRTGRWNTSPSHCYSLRTRIGTEKRRYHECKAASVTVARLSCEPSSGFLHTPWHMLHICRIIVYSDRSKIQLITTCQCFPYELKPGKHHYML